jgi:hypothetical protein
MKVSLYLIRAAILSLMPAPSPAWNETQEQYEARVDTISEAIHSTAENRGMAFGLVVTYWGESRFSPRIHEGTRRGDGGLSICLGQIRRDPKLTAESNPLEYAAWEALGGTSLEATTLCVQRSAKIMRGAYWHCRSLDPKWGMPEAFVLYGSGRTCRAHETPYRGIFEDRGRKWRDLMARFK